MNEKRQQAGMNFGWEGTTFVVWTGRKDNGAILDDGTVIESIATRR